MPINVRFGPVSETLPSPTTLTTSSTHQHMLYVILLY